MKRTLLATLVAGIWINLSEFFRNEILLKPQWHAHYANMGSTFPSAPVNGALWVLWGGLLAAGLTALRTRFSFSGTFALGWMFGFALMWVVIGNLGVLPLGILPAAVPLSLLETGVAVFLIDRVRRTGTPRG